MFIFDNVCFILTCKHLYELNMRTEFFHKYCICYKLCGLKQTFIHSFTEFYASYH